jgi:hypothetical protein
VIVYTANFGGFDTPKTYPLPVRIFVDDEHANPRLGAKFWKTHPQAVAEDGQLAVWIDASLNVVVPDLERRIEVALGDADLLLVRHPWRDCIYDEAVASRAGEKYDDQPLEAQVEAYRAAGHPEHWGLAAGSFFAVRIGPYTTALMEDWWEENVGWSIQDQLSLPPLLRKHGDVTVSWLPADVIWGSSPWLRFEGHVRPEVWR